MSSVYYQFAVLLLAAAGVGAIALRLRQPLIVAYLIVGIALGPSGLGWITAHEPINLLAQIGVTVLLFVVGLRLDLRIVRNVGPVALATGIGQIVFTTAIGYLIALALAMSPITALYVAIALTFSSTIIIVKLLSDKRELDTLHGRIALGFLIVQDVAVVVAMLLLGSYQSSAGDESIWRLSLEIGLKLAAALAGVALLMRYVLPRLLYLLAHSQELLLIFALAWGTTLAAAGDMLGFSKEVGAFLAGFSLASTAYREAIVSRLTGLRDFLLLFFFIDLGGKLDLSTFGAQIGGAVLLSLFVLVGNPVIVMAIMGYMGYRKRTGFLAGLTVAQISEFSIVFATMGVTLGHIGEPALGLITLVGLVTITLSTYMIINSQALYTVLSPWLSPFEREVPFREIAMRQAQQEADAADVIVFGAGRFGHRMVSQLRARGYSVLAVDYDPERVRVLQHEGIPVRFGDAEDPDIATTLPLDNAKWVVSTLPEEDINALLVHALQEHGFCGKIAVAARNEEDDGYEQTLLRNGVARVIWLFEDAADSAAVDIARALADDGPPPAVRS